MRPKRKVTRVITPEVKPPATTPKKPKKLKQCVFGARDVGKKGIRINVQFDFITLNLGNGRTLTSGRSGEKGSGSVPENVFMAFSNAVRAHKPRETGLLLDEMVEQWALKVLPKLWPEWNTPPKTFKLGQKITYDFGKRRSAPTGVCQGVIEELPKRQGGTYTVRFPGARLRMTGDLLTVGSNQR